MRDWDARATAQRAQAIEPSGCDTVFPGVGHFYRDRRLYVATRSPRVVLRENVFLSRPTRQACPCDRALDGHDSLGWVRQSCPCAQHTQPCAQCARDLLTSATLLSNCTLHYVVHCLSYYSLALFMDTVHMSFTNLFLNQWDPGKKNPCKLRRHKVIHYFFS